ncbi:MAG: polyphosphate--glucose phosphotransferase [Puniceicoccales bacterium]
MEILGIDIGGSGVKAALVNTETGELLTERYRVDTPQPAKFNALMETLEEMGEHFQWHGPVGCGFPGVIQKQEIRTAANLHKTLVGKRLGDELAPFYGQSARLINDADAAGLAEMRFGLGKDKSGLVLFLTIGTGIGTAMFLDGKLVPNSEFGHMTIPYGKDKFIKAEHYAADSARKRDDLSWEEWAKRFNVFLEEICVLANPDEVVVGGGVAKKGEKFMEYIDSPCPLSLAKLQNRAGIIGAALAAEQALSV